MELNHRQKKIKEIFLETDKNILVQAGPGTGKSTTMLYLTQFLTPFESGVMLAFNKRIVEELTEKLREKSIRNVQAATLHSFGLAMIRKAGMRFKIDKNKFYKIFNSLEGDFIEEMKSLPKKEELKIMFAVKFLDNFSRIYLSEDFNLIKDTAENAGIWDITTTNLLKKVWEVFLDKRKEYNNMSYKIIDFTDMLYYPILFNLKVEENYTHVFIDESQDLSLLQHKIFELICNNDSFQKFISVGDFRQSINGFAGASPESFELFQKYSNTVTLPLDITYRCPPIITDELSKIYSGVQPFKKKGGVLQTVDEKSLINIPSKSLVLCRNTAPLIHTSFLLGNLGKKCYILGKDTLNSIKQQLKDYMDMNIHKALVEASKELHKVSSNSSTENRIKFYFLKDAIDVATSLKKNFNLPYGSTLKNYFNKAMVLFTPTPESIVLSTIHKSKGLEAKNVYLINKKKLMPSKMARGKVALVQEKNLFFVAMSRSSENFYYLNIKIEEE